MIPTNITYREFLPDSELIDYIAAYWYFSIKTTAVKPFDILPDGCFDLLMVIKNNQIVETKLTGIWSKRVTVNYTENSEIFAIRFKPLAIGSIFNFEISKYLNKSIEIPLKEINLDGQVMLDGLYGNPELLVQYLNRSFLRAVENNKTDMRLKKCFSLVEKSAGCLTMDHISKEIGLSSRQMHRVISKMIGLGLKDYSKIVRFEKTLNEMKYNKLNYIHYYDQSHLIREVKQFSGMTPESLNLNKNDRFIQYYKFPNK